MLQKISQGEIFRLSISITVGIVTKNWCFIASLRCMRRLTSIALNKKQVMDIHDIFLRCCAQHSWEMWYPKRVLLVFHTSQHKLFVPCESKNSNILSAFSFDNFKACLLQLVCMMPSRAVFLDKIQSMCQTNFAFKFWTRAKIFQWLNFCELSK